MATIESGLTERLTEQGWSGDVVGGVLIAVVGLVHFFGLQVGGAIGFLLLLVVWPLVGGAVAAHVERERDGRDWGTASVVAGAYAALVVTAVVFLAGVASLWSGFITTSFGVTFWPVVFTILLVLTISWTVFAYTGGYIEHLVARRGASAEATTEEPDTDVDPDGEAEGEETAAS